MSATTAPIAAASISIQAAATSTATNAPSLLSLIDSSPYWSSFLGDLSAGLLLLILASWLLPKFLRWKEMPKVILRDFKRRKDAFVFSKVGEEFEASLRLVIQNRGVKTLEKYYWEIYIKQEPDVSIEMPRIVTQPGHATIAYEEGRDHQRIYGYMVLPIFPLDNVDFPFEVKIKVKTRRPITLHYYFRTEYGEYPFWSWIALWSGKLGLLRGITIR